MNNDNFSEKYNSVVSSLNNALDNGKDITTEIGNIVFDLYLSDKISNIAGFTALIDFVNDHKDAFEDGKADSLISSFKDSIVSILNNDFVNDNFENIMNSELLQKTIISSADEEVLRHLFKKSKQASDKGQITTEQYNKLFEKFGVRGIDVTVEKLDTLSNEQLEEAYKKARDDRQKIADKIDEKNIQNLNATIDEFKQDHPKTKIDLDKETILEKVDDLDLNGDVDKKVIINFVIDPEVGERRTTPVTSLSKDRFMNLRKTLRKYMNWLQEKNLKVEDEVLVNENGEKQTVVHVRNGEVYNITLSCSNLAKDAINKGVDKLKKAKKWTENMTGGFKETLKRIKERHQARKEIVKEKAKKAFAPVVDVTGKAAEKLAKSAAQFSEKAYDKAEEMRTTSEPKLQEAREKLERLKNKQGTAVAGEQVTFSGPPQAQTSGMSM